MVEAGWIWLGVLAVGGFAYLFATLWFAHQRSKRFWREMQSYRPNVDLRRTR
jgi:hypothetical protein